MLDNRNVVKEEAIEQSLRLQGVKFKLFQLMGKIDRRVRKQLKKSKVLLAKQEQANLVAMAGQ